MTIRTKLQFYSILISAFVWGGLTVVFVKVPVDVPVKDPDFREIRIQLSAVSETELDSLQSEAGESEPVQFEDVPQIPEPVVEQVVETPPVFEEVVIEAPAPAPAPAPKAAEPAPQPAPAPKAAEPVTQPAAPKKAEPAPQPAAPKAAEPAPAAKSPTPAPEPAKQTMVKSVEEQIAEMKARKGTKKTISDEEFDKFFGEDSNATSSVSTGEKTFASQQGPSLSGSAAVSATDTGTAAEAASGKKTDDQISEGTASMLNDIFDTAGTASSGNRTGSERGSSAGTGSGSSSSSSSGSSARVQGGTGSSLTGNADSIIWGDGTPGRNLVRPSTTEIILSDGQKSLVTATIRDIHISFTVRADGNVERNSIAIDKKAGIPAAITQEIERQISNWYFKQGDSDGQAVFVYSIIKE